MKKVEKSQIHDSETGLMHSRWSDEDIFIFSGCTTRYTVNNNILSLIKCNTFVVGLFKCYHKNTARLPCQTLRLWGCCPPTHTQAHLNIQSSFQFHESFPKGITYWRIKMPQMLLSTFHEYHFRCSLLMGSSYNLQKEKKRHLNILLTNKKELNSVWTAIFLSAAVSF